MRIAISGYYGFGNVGDEAVLAAMLAALKDRLPSAEFVVLSANPNATTRLHGVPSVSRLGAQAARVITGADLFLSGGGSLIQDVTSARSAMYYLSILGVATTLARRTMVYAQGLGPVRRRWIRAAARPVLDRVHLITLRDEDSRRLLQEFGVRQSAQLVADPAFAVVPAAPERAEEILASVPRPRIGVALRPVGNGEYAGAVSEALRAIQDQTGGSVVMLVFHPEQDMAISQQVASACAGTVVADLSPQEMMAVVGAMDLLVGVRLHALIAAVAGGVALVGLSYDPKVDGLFRRLGVGQLLTLPNLQAPQLRQALLSAWETRHAVRPQLLQAAASLREDALRAADLAAALVAVPVRRAGAKA